MIGGGGGNQRLIINVRRANRHFVEPCGLNMSTGDAFSELHLGGAEELFISLLDIANAFYMLELPEPLCAKFCSLRLPARCFGITDIDGVPVSKNTIVYP